MERSIHDSNLYGYVMLDSPTSDRAYQLVLFTEFTQRTPIEYTDVIFHHVVAHHFEGMQSGNILFDVEPDAIEQIFDEYQELFTRFQIEDWPLHYDSPEALFTQLQAHDIRAFRIVPSYGGTGWIWAERMEKRPRAARRTLELYA